MNFLAHDHILPPGSSSLTRVGSALPDLWPLLPKRPLPLVVLRSLKADGSPPAEELARGISAHMKADSAFHRHADFQRRIEVVAPALIGVWPELRHTHLAAHVLVEMLLDRWLLLQYPDMVDRYYSAFTSTNISTACQMTVTEGASQDALREHLERFVSSGFLSDYASPQGLALRFLYTLRRARFRPDPDSSLPPLTDLVDSHTRKLSEGWTNLLDDVREKVFEGQ